MKPVAIKLYGLIPITKKRYVFMMASSVIIVVLCVAWARFWLELPLPWEGGQPKKALADIWLARNFYWLVLGGLMLGLVDSIFVFRRFAKLEADQTNPARSFIKK